LEKEKDQYNDLLQKLQALLATLTRQGIEAKVLAGETLQAFTARWLSLANIEDHGKYLKIDSYATMKFTKTYRLVRPPEAGDLDFWLLDYYQYFKSEAFLSLQLIPRDARQDRRIAEYKADFVQGLSRSSKSSTNTIIRENKQLAQELLDKPASFDYLLFLTVICDDLEKLQEIDNHIKQPLKYSCLSSLDRQQAKNWLYSLPFCYNKLANQDKLFSALDFAKSSYPFVRSDSGTADGPLLGLSVETEKPIFLDEYQRSYFHNRSINFIGDSGSGKTASAKLFIKRRLHQSGRKFFIIDSTLDGWKFFIDFFAGIIIELDNFSLSQQESLFAPLILLDDSVEALNAHIDSLLALFAFISGKNQSLSINDKSFLSLVLKALYAQNPQPCLSDFYQYLSTIDSMNSKFWQEAISPYCHITQGIYAHLLDGKFNIVSDEKLVLFSFRNINNDPNYLSTCLFLINHFISQKVIFQKQTGITLVIDEAWKIFQNASIKHGQDLLTYLARAGRGLDLGLWSISQKPSDLPSELHSSASSSLCFQLKESQDRHTMASFANYNANEKALIDSFALNDSGVALFKSTKSSELVRILLDPIEALLCNSTRDLSNRREALFQSFLKQNLSKSEAAQKAVEELRLSGYC